jgi:hypothetical protein
LSRVQNQINSKTLNQLNDQLNNQASKYVYYQIWSRVSNLARSQVSNHVWNRIWYGQQRSHWLAFVAYMIQVLRVEAPKQFALLMLLSQEVNWWTPTKETVFVTRKPKKCVIKNNKFVKLVYQDGYTIT